MLPRKFEIPLVGMFVNPKPFPLKLLLAVTTPPDSVSPGVIVLTVGMTTLLVGIGMKMLPDH